MSQGAATNTVAEELAASLPASSAAMQAGGVSDDSATESAPHVVAQPDARPPPPADPAAAKQAARAVPAKRSWSGGLGGHTSPAMRAPVESLPSISEVFGSAGSAPSNMEALRPAAGIGPKQTSLPGPSAVRSNTAVARLPSGWGSRASEASSTTVLGAASLDAAVGSTVAATSEQLAGMRSASLTEPLPDPPLGVAAPVGNMGAAAGKPPVPRLSSLASAASGDAALGSRLLGPVLRKAGSNALGSIGSMTGSVAGSSHASGSALPGAIDAALATHTTPRADDAKTAGAQHTGLGRSRLSVNSWAADRTPGLPRSPTDDSRKAAAAAPADALSLTEAPGPGAGPRASPAADGLALHELPPSELAACALTAERLHGPRAPQVCRTHWRYGYPVTTDEPPFIGCMVFSTVSHSHSLLRLVR